MNLILIKIRRVKGNWEIRKVGRNWHIHLGKSFIRQFWKCLSVTFMKKPWWKNVQELCPICGRDLRTPHCQETVK